MESRTQRGTNAMTGGWAVTFLPGGVRLILRRDRDGFHFGEWNEDGKPISPPPPEIRGRAFQTIAEAASVLQKATPSSQQRTRHG
jgi:hypothetical protein